MSRLLKVCFVIVILFLGLIFHLRNGQMIEIDYYAGMIELPLSLVIVMALFAGAVLGVLASMPMMLRLKKDNLRLNKQAKMSEEEINNLRVIPVKDAL